MVQEAAAILTGKAACSALLKNGVITRALPKQRCIGKACHFPYIE